MIYINCSVVLEKKKRMISSLVDEITHACFVKTPNFEDFSFPQDYDKKDGGFLEHVFVL
jgi:hypothetical protein